MRALRIILLALAFIALQAHAKDGRNLVVKENGSAGKRIALVIGNGNYQHPDSLPKLANPTHDAEDIAKALRGFGFEVIEKKDQSLEGMSDAITEFSRKIGDSEAALFYFAGHGLQVKGQNYLIPVDARIETEAQVSFKSINVNLILDEMDNGKSRANIVLLDACRNNPISGKFRSGATRGLAPITSQPKGTVIVYATDPGNVAADGDGRNGLFTAGLLTAFKGSDLSLGGVLTRASSEVERASGQKQTPYVNGPMTLQKNFQFGQGTQIASLVPVPAPVGGGVSLDDIKKQQEARAQWDKWQAGMKADFDKIVALNAEPDLQVTAWDRFLAGYTQKNPFGNDDEQLRSEARNRKRQAEAEKQRRASAQPVMAAGGSATGNSFKDCPDCTEMMTIPAGRFTMGSPGGEAGRVDDEGPLHEVNVARFALGKYEVTVGEFRRFAQATGYRTDAEKNTGNASGCYAWGASDGKFDWRPGRYWDAPGFSQTERHPAVCVSWNDANTYVEWLAKTTGKEYRLPSEAEWEYAARAGTTTARYWGDDPNQACRYANVVDQSKGTGAYANGFGGVKHECNDGYFFTAPAGAYLPNAFGLHDMIGNALEWTNDCWHDSYAGAPTNGSAWTVGDCAKRVLRGGSWSYEPQYGRAAYRNGYGPAGRYDNLGFRLARTLP